MQTAYTTCVLSCRLSCLSRQDLGKFWSKEDVNLVPLDLTSVFVAFLGGGNFLPILTFLF